VQLVMMIAVVALIWSVSGCGNFDRHVANITGSSEPCIDGVNYIQFRSHASVKYTREGRMATC
jgi:hypothetical protein